MVRLHLTKPNHLAAYTILEKTTPYQTKPNHLAAYTILDKTLNITFICNFKKLLDIDRKIFKGVFIGTPYIKRATIQENIILRVKALGHDVGI